MARQWRDGVAASAAVLAFLAAIGTATAADDTPSGTVSLPAAVTAALLHDPSLAAYGFEQRALEARALQESRLRNPTLNAELENVARTGGNGEQAQATVSLMQVLELGGKRAKRVAVARLDQRLAGWDYERARLDTATRAFTAFVAALLAQERVDLAARLRDLARESVAAVRRQVDAGAASPIEASRSEAALAEAEATVARRERESRAARSALGAVWGEPGARITRLAGTLGPLATPPTLDDMEPRLATAPDLARWSDVVARAEAGVLLESSRRVPDVSVRLGARRFVDTESNALVAELSVPIPVFDRNADAVVEAEARVERARAERRAAAVSAAAAVHAAHADMTSAFDEAQTIERRVLPRVQAALAQTRRGYAAGGVRLLELREAERSIAEVEGTYLEALARYHTAAATLERLTGTTIADHAGEEAR